MPPPFPQIRLPRPDRRARLENVPGTDVPGICQPFEPGDRLPFWAAGTASSTSYLFDTEVDPAERENRTGTASERQLLDALAGELRRIQAPADLLTRVGVA